MKKFKKITFKYVKKGTGEVTLRNLPMDLGTPRIPTEIVQVLEDYGFTDSGYFAEPVPEALYVDNLEPSGVDFYEDFTHMTYFVPVAIETVRQRMASGPETGYRVTYQGVREVTHKDLYQAFGNGFEAWHKAGRPLGPDNVIFKIALQQAVLDANEQLAEQAAAQSEEDEE